MSVREEDRQKNTCPSRGLGIAAAAIGVGVGAALYYFFSKRPENPNGEGSTSEWSYDRSQPFMNHHHHYVSSDDSYTTISEHDTTDTSIIDSPQFSRHSDSDSDTNEELSTDSDTTNSEDVNMNDSTFETGYLSSQNQSLVTSESEAGMDWDVTSSSLGVPEDRRERIPMYSVISSIGAMVSPRRKTTEDEQFNILRQQALAEEEEKIRLRQEAFRERTWTLEECSICFDVMLRDQEVTSLACAHNFHTECIMPWLQEKQTCPNCRKVA